MTEVKTKEQLEAEWWEKWYAEDFTWEGLKKKPLEGWVVYDRRLLKADSGQIYGGPSEGRGTIEGGEKATLQDYWRADPETGILRDDAELALAGELCLTQGQKTFHRAHLPLYFKGGQSSGKEDWSKEALDDIVASRLMVAKETYWKDYLFGRHQGADDRAQFQGGVWLRAPEHPLGAEVPISVRYDSACFAKHALFHEAVFLGRTNFRRVMALEDAVFYKVEFLGDAVFQDAYFACGSMFPGVMFSRIANFRAATMSESGASTAARYYESAFAEVTSGRGASFNGATFCKEALFDSGRFLSGVSFLDAHFKGNASFLGTKFGGAIFDNAVFSKGARFVKVSFSKIQFNGAIFERPALFSEISWPSFPENWHSAFQQTIFKEPVSFAGSGLKAFAAFDGAIFERGVHFDEPGEQSAQKSFDAELRGAVATAKSEGEAYRERRERTLGRETKSKGDKEFKAEVDAQLRNLRDTRLRELERGCRAIKQAMEKASSKPREQLFYRFELHARRMQHEIPRSERVVSYLYGWASDYGASLFRPILWLTGLTIGFGIIYWWVATGCKIDPTAPIAWGALADSMSFSASRGFPFGAFEWVTRDWMDARQKQSGSGVVFVLRLLATFQSILALALVFLFGLAIRRRFQIS